MKELLKSFEHAILGDYSAYHILRRDKVAGAIAPSPQTSQYRVVPADRAMIAACADPLMREQAGYAGDGALAYACLHDEQIVGLCFYWHGERY